MNQTTKWIAGIIITIVVIAIGYSVIKGPSKPPKETTPIKIGAILPLSGGAAIWGEQLKNGMELAVKNLLKDGVTVDIIYEDSQASPSIGLSAYNKLVNIEKVDVIFSAFSRVSAPLISLSKENKVPLVMTVAVLNDAPAQNKFTYRLYLTANEYIDPYFNSFLNKDSYRSISVLYINDEYGVSVRDKIRKQASKNNIDIISEESFLPGNSDFRTQLSKIKSAKPDDVIFVGAIPPELTNALTQFNELGVKADFIEAGLLLSLPAVRGNLKDVINGIDGKVYTLSLASFETRDEGRKFITEYEEAYSNKPTFIAPIGYDMVNFVYDVTGGKHTTGDEFVSKANKLKTLNTITNGKLKIDDNGEINPIPVSALISNGDLITVE